MAHKLSLTVRLDLDRATALVDVQGVVTAQNVAALRSVLCRVSALQPEPRITVDVSAAEVTDRAVLKDLRQSVPRLSIQWRRAAVSSVSRVPVAA